MEEQKEKQKNKSQESILEIDLFSFKRMVATISILALVAGIFLNSNTAQGGDFSFSQTSWSGGQTSNIANHADNQTGWNEYYTKDSGIVTSNGGADINLAQQIGSSSIDFATEGNYAQEDATNGTDFNDGKVNLTGVAVGSSWINRSMPGSASGWASITYGDGTFVAIASYKVPEGGGTGLPTNVAATSTDGINWTQKTLPATVFWDAITYGNGKFVAVSNGSNISAVSTDGGETWTQGTLPGSYGWKVTYGNGTFVAVAHRNPTINVAATSTDGTNWTARTLPTSAYWTGIAYGNGTFVAVASASGTAATSPDGITWTQRNTYFSYGGIAVNFGNGKFIVTTTQTNKVASSSDGSNWSTITLPTEVEGLGSVAYGDGKFVGVFSTSATSPNGTTWTAGGYTGFSYSVAYGNSLFVAALYMQNYVATSSGGYTTSQPYYVTTSDSSQISTSAWSHLTGAAITQTTPTNTDIKYLVSFDDRSTWKYWDGDSWESSTLDNLQTNGMNKTAIEGLSQANWEATGGFVPGSTSYIDIAADLSTTDSTATPELDNIQFNYSLNSYSTSTQTLTSSVYNTTFSQSSPSKIEWSETLLTNTDVKFQIRTSADGTNWGSWCGPDNEEAGTCSSSDYFTDPEGNEIIDDIQRDNTNDQYFQLKAFLSSIDGVNTPTLSDFAVTYTDAALPTISGFEDEGLYFDSVTPITTNGDATINGNSFTSGTIVTEEGTYTIVVDNGAGTQVSASFTILKNKTVVDPDSAKMNEDYTLGIIDTGGDDAGTADQATIKVNYTLVSNSASLYIPRNTVITPSEGGTIDITKLTTLDISQSINNENSNSKGAVKIGIPSQNLTFSQPITVTMDVQPSYNGKILTVYSKPDDGGSWTYETTCLVSDSKCTFTTTHATEYTGNYEISNSPTPTDVNMSIDAIIALTCTDSVTMGTITGTGESNLATNDATCTVSTNNSSGYSLTWQASSANMVNPSEDIISPYTPTASNVPETWSVASTESEWGAKLKSTSTTYNLSTWGNLDTYTGGSWLNVSTSPFQIITRNTETTQLGDDEIITFGAEIGADKFQATGIYNVEVIMTATTL